MTAEHNEPGFALSKADWDGLMDRVRTIGGRLDSVLEKLDEQFAVLKEILYGGVHDNGNGISDYDLFEESDWDGLY